MNDAPARNRLSIWLGVVVWAAVIASGAQAATVFYVSPDGSDADPGTQAKPFTTIGRAQKAVRKIIASGLKGDVTVVIGYGVYELAAPLKFGPADSGTKQCAVTYRAANDGKVLVSGGRRIAGWKRGSGKFWTTTVSDVKSGKWHFRQLFVYGRRATRARTPNAGGKASHLKLTSATQAKDLKTWRLGLPAKDVSTSAGGRRENRYDHTGPAARQTDPVESPEQGQILLPGKRH